MQINLELLRVIKTKVIVSGSIDMPIGELPWSPCTASIVDRFGIWWYLSSASHRPPEDYDYWNGKPLSTGN
jgi:uncharacterized glyoxalase superfamily protein PhnB